MPLVAAVVLVDTTFFAVLAPLLPAYAAALGLSKTTAGILAGAFAAGVLIAALPSGLLAARIGVRTTLLLGLALTASSSVAFGLGERFAVLLVARLAAGVGSACSWTAAVGWLARVAPANRRGELIGFTVSAAVAGALLGPAVGAAAGRIGTGTAFALVAVACAALAIWVGCLARPGPEPAGTTLGNALRDPRVRPPLALILLAPLLFGVLGVLVPLTLGQAGWSSERLGGLYVAAAATEALVQPLLGRWADRHGAMAPVSAGLAVSVGVLLGLAYADRPVAIATLVVLAAISFGATLVPGMALLAQAADSSGLGSVLAMALANLAWALGHSVGGPAGGWLGDRFGDGRTYLVLALLCLAAFVAVRAGALGRGRRRV
jgi:predicted MFS family arabinose efflux permease